ncbi:MAG: xanthine dehydrogenase molybdopterin binding subunit [Xanthomonadales bacterium]|nr:xanthine dehydrogenase molybdopterin binding subunit [Xanthomonadales bacterium]
MKDRSTVHRSLPHDSAHLHVQGRAQYTDDIPLPGGTLHAAVGWSQEAHARLKHLDLSQVRTAPGVVAVLTVDDIPGRNNHGPILADDPLMAEDTVEYVGQVLFTVVAETAGQARRAARLAKVDYESLEPVLQINDALDRSSEVVPPQTLVRGDPDEALAAGDQVLSGRFSIGGQDHFYLEGQVALALPGDDGDFVIHASTQHPSEVQHLVAEALGLQSKDVMVHCRRMGGAFGGKETQPALFACLAALAAYKTGRPVKLRLNRDDDMTVTGKRHPYQVDYRVAFNESGMIQGIDIRYSSDCGRSADLSGPVNARTIFHADNCYFLEHIRVESRRLKTHKASNTAFRGFGGPQGMVGIEHVMGDIARHLGLDPLEVRLRNLYGQDDRNVTPYGMTVEDNIAPEVIRRLSESSQYAVRRQAVAKFNQANPEIKKGLALTPVKFGISFTARHYNQAGALIHIYRDGSILLNHGGTEMGQGLFTKVAQVVAEVFQVGVDQIRCSATDTSKVPNTSATAASAGSDLNGMAAYNAARTLRDRLTCFAADRYGVPEDQIRYQNGMVQAGEHQLGFEELVDQAYLARVSLSSTGFYKTPKIDYDPNTLQGRPFYYFCYGAAVSEVAIDCLTGESRLLRVDILHDVGKSLNPALDLGQIEGGFIQGVGWLTCEELCWDDSGRLTTHAPSTYKIPTVTDWPEQFYVEIAAWSENSEATIYRSKAVGEPPFMLAISVFEAIKDAVSAAGPGRVQLDAPATPERILQAVASVRQ